MTFSDYKPLQLVGKQVLLTIGLKDEPAFYFAKITKVVNKSFRLDNPKGSYLRFDAATGQAINYKTYLLDLPTVCFCKLVTDKEIENLRQGWADERELYKLKKDLITFIEKTKNTELLKTFEILIKK